MDTKKDRKMIYYYVQSLNTDHEIETICHSRQKDELYYKFLFKKQADSLAEQQKQIRPDKKFRVVKCTEMYKADEWF